MKNDSPCANVLRGRDSSPILGQPLYLAVLHEIFWIWVNCFVRLCNSVYWPVLDENLIAKVHFTGLQYREQETTCRLYKKLWGSVKHSSLQCKPWRQITLRSKRPSLSLKNRCDLIFIGINAQEKEKVNRLVHSICARGFHNGGKAMQQVMTANSCWHWQQTWCWCWKAS